MKTSDKLEWQKKVGPIYYIAFQFFDEKDFEYDQMLIDKHLCAIRLFY